MSSLCSSVTSLWRSSGAMEFDFEHQHYLFICFLKFSVDKSQPIKKMSMSSLIISTVQCKQKQFAFSLLSDVSLNTVEKRKAVKRKKGCRERFRKVTTTNVAICPSVPTTHLRAMPTQWRWRDGGSSEETTTVQCVASV